MLLVHVTPICDLGKDFECSVDSKLSFYNFCVLLQCGLAMLLVFIDGVTSVNWLFSICWLRIFLNVFNKSWRCRYHIGSKPIVTFTHSLRVCYLNVICVKPPFILTWSWSWNFSLGGEKYRGALRRAAVARLACCSSVFLFPKFKLPCSFLFCFVFSNVQTKCCSHTHTAEPRTQGHFYLTHHVQSLKRWQCCLLVFSSLTASDLHGFAVKT